MSNHAVPEPQKDEPGQSRRMRSGCWEHAETQWCESEGCSVVSETPESQEDAASETWICDLCGESKPKGSEWQHDALVSACPECCETIRQRGAAKKDAASEPASRNGGEPNAALIVRLRRCATPCECECAILSEAADALESAEQRLRAVRSHWLVAALLEHVAGEHRGPVRVGSLSYADCEALDAAFEFRRRRQNAGRRPVR